MSQSDVWAEDSDPDCDTEARSARIRRLEDRYRAGQSLFIMSAALRGELAANPWARKRKRTQDSEGLAPYFPVTKVLQPSTTRKKRSSGAIAATEPSSARSVEATISSVKPITPVWDQSSSCQGGPEPLAKPVARVIDFRRYDSQALGGLVLKSEPVRTSREHGTSPDTLAVRRRTGNRQREIREDKVRYGDPSTPQKEAATNSPSQHGFKSCARPTSHDCAISRPPELKTPYAAKFANVPPQAAVSPPDVPCPELTAVNSARPAEDELLLGSYQSVELEHSSALQSTLSSLRSDRSPRTPDLSSPAKESSGNSQRSHPCLDVSDDSMLNTQAELASAQKGLAEALQFRETEANLSAISEESSPAAGAYRMSSILNDQAPQNGARNSPQNTIVADILGDSFAFGKSGLNSPQRSPISIRHNEPQKTTPIARQELVLPSFAKFESPVGTQESFMAFASPLTFSPIKCGPREARGDREEDTIDDIQRYLIASNFDAAEEARKLMEN